MLRKLVNVTVGHDPARTIERARAAVAAIDPERDPAALASVYFDWAYAEMVRGNGAQDELLENWRTFEERAGPDAPKSLFGVFYVNAVDDFEAARARFAFEDRWYAERGEDVWRAERRIHYGSAELRAGQFELGEQLIEEGCETLAQVATPGPWAATFRIRAIVDVHRGRADRARETLLPLIVQAESAGRAWWEALFLSGLAFVEFADGNHGEVDRVLARMHERVASVGVRDFLPDRSEPYHVEALVALGEPERAREVLERLEWRDRTLPRLWIATTLPRARALVLDCRGRSHRRARRARAAGRRGSGEAPLRPGVVTPSSRTAASAREAKAFSGRRAPRGAHDLRASRRARVGKARSCGAGSHRPPAVVG